MTDKKLISTSELSRRVSIPGKQLFAKFQDLGYIVREEDQWYLTDRGKSAGGEYRVSDKAGRYVVWPEDISIQGASRENMLNATALGEAFELPARRINQILSEHGWIKKHLKGWLVTPLGQRVGGEQRENTQSGVPYVVWPESVLQNSSLRDTLKEIKGDGVKAVTDSMPSADKSSGFRDKFAPKLRAADGHYVRSRAEMLIDNWLYTAEIVHAYERRLPVEEEVYCDFYLPGAKVYLEFWGMESDAKYRERKEAKKAIYQQYDFNLIEVHDKDISNLDDVLPRLLLKFGITTY